MKSLLFLALMPLLFVTSLAHGQGFFIFDQQSSIDESPFPNGAGPTIQQFVPPYGQSFTPSLSSIDFIRLNLNDRNLGNGSGATLYINLRTVSINGTIAASTTPVILADGFTGVVTFLFVSSVVLTPNSVYYFEPVVQFQSDQWNLIAGEYNYTGGSGFSSGAPSTGSDYWFREGIIIPEPSSVVLILLGGVVLIYVRRTQSKMRFKV